MLRFVFIIVLTLLPAFLRSQGVISGSVQEAGSGEAIIGANVLIAGSGKGAATNRYGYFAIAGLPYGEYTLRISAIGYHQETRTITLDEQQSVRLVIELRSAVIELGEVSIEADREFDGTQRISVTSVPMEQILRLPSLGGEVDLFRALQLLPGVQESSELSSGLYIRGGSPDQNLILLDRMVLYNPSHLGGFLSTFNADAINNVTLIKGAMPAEYGGRLSSVVDVSMREGGRDRIRGAGGISMIDSRLTIDGPINEDITFMLSGRRVYLDWLVDLMTDEGALNYYFYDLVAKTNIKMGENDRIFFSGFFGRDVMGDPDDGYSDDFHISWGNSAGNLRWTHIFGNNLFTNVSAVVSDYRFSSELEEWDDTRFKSISGILDYSVRGEAEYFHSAEHTFKGGIELTLHTFTSEASSDEYEFNEFTPHLPTHRGTELSLFLQDEWMVDESFTLQLGGRAFYFDRGPYFRLEPRFAAFYTTEQQLTFKAAFIGANQFLHLVSRNDISLPTDMWFPSTATLPPSWSLQYVLGVERPFLDGMYSVSLEGYYKSMNNLLEFRDDAVFSIFAPLENELTRGDGQGYGIELFVQKRKGSFTGWLGYTLAWTDRTFPELNDGNSFPPRYDRRHDVSLVLNYTLSHRWEFTAVWVYGTGQAFTFPVAQYMLNEHDPVRLLYSERNGYRLPAYHRLDLNFSYAFKWFDWDWKASINLYNTYSRMNPYARYLDHNWGTGRWELKQLTLFPLLPTFGLSFIF
ncbi:MAG: TonB-dependent receptor [Bacteroidetes bacterium]|nr:TonB-dependent receptor [Bacteroidota bacterium]